MLFENVKKLNLVHKKSMRTILAKAYELDALCSLRAFHYKIDNNKISRGF